MFKLQIAIKLTTVGLRQGINENKLPSRILPGDGIEIFAKDIVSRKCKSSS